MAKVTYDLDTSCGLMDQIQKLISPPEEPRKKQPETSRRGGRVVSKEACDSCGEGGDLLCCDKCFAAFHLLCHDPPLNEDDVPYGEWLCRQCRSVGRSNLGQMSVTPPDDALSTTSSKSNRSSSMNVGSHKQRGSKKSGNAPPSNGRSTPDYSVVQRCEMSNSDDLLNANLPAHPLSRLARDWRNVNPREFSLPIVLVPNELEPTAPIGNGSGNGQSDNGNNNTNNTMSSNSNKRQRISTYAATLAASSVGPAGSSSALAATAHYNAMGPPHGGSSTPGQSSTSRRRSALSIPAHISSSSYDHQLAVYHSSGPPPAKKPILEPDGSIVNLQPLILCYVCSRSCRSAPLLQCDYCPLAFHLDCLEVPLTTFPSSPWMCPNHPEHYLDIAFAPESRQSLSKRIRLWRHYVADSTIDFNAIKLRFLNKLHRSTPPYRTKVSLIPPGSATSLAHVPVAVKEAYNIGVDPLAFSVGDLPLTDMDQPIDDQISRLQLSKMRRQLDEFRFVCSSTECHRPVEVTKKKIAVLPAVVEAIMNVVEGKVLPSDLASRLDSHTVTELARQRLEQLAPAPFADSCRDVSSILALKALVELANTSESTNVDERINEALAATKRASARALFVLIGKAVGSSQPVLPIVSKCTSIGTSTKCSISLDKIASDVGCCRVSPLHGTVIYDELTDSYEFLVYSEFGAVVDGVRFGVGVGTCNASESAGDCSRAVAVEQSSTLLHCSNNKNSLVWPSHQCACLATQCDTRSYSFDGSAPLRHGSVIEIGCLRFVFARLLLADVKRVVADLSKTAADIIALSEVSR